MESTSTCTEEVEDSDDTIDEDNLYRVLEMLNFKVVPKEPGDPDYSHLDYLPPEDKIYSIEFCKFRNDIDVLTNRNAELEITISERDDKIQKLEETVVEKSEQVERLTHTNSHEDRLLNAEEMNETLQGQLEQVKTELMQKQEELKVTNTKLTLSENELLKQSELVKGQEEMISKYKRVEDDSQNIILEREQEIEEHRSVLFDLRLKLEEVERVSLDKKRELAKTQGKVNELQEKLEHVEKRNSELNLQLESAKESVANLEEQLKEKIVESSKQENNLKTNQKTIDALENQLVEYETKAEEQQKLVDEEKSLKLDLIEKNKKLQNCMSSLNSEFEMIIKELKKTTSTPDLSELLQNPNDHHNGTQEDYTANPQQQELDGLAAFVWNKFQCWAQNMKLIQDELAKTKTFAASLLQIVNTQNKKRGQPFPTITSTSGSTSSVVVTTNSHTVSSAPVNHQPTWSSCASRQPEFSSPYRPPMRCFTTPINAPSPTSPFIRPSYRDIARLPSGKTLLESPSNILLSINQSSPHVSRTPSGLTLPATASAIPTTSSANNVEFSNRGNACNKKIPLTEMSSVKPLEVRQLFTDSSNDPITGTNDSDRMREPTRYSNDHSKSLEEKETNKNLNNTKQHGRNDSAEYQNEHVCLCGYKSNSKYNLTKHIRYYTTEPKFHCQLCSRRFVRAHYLRAHYQSRHKKSYQIFNSCRLCGRQFRTMKELRCHHKGVHSRGAAKGKKSKLSRKTNATTQQTTLQNTPANKEDKLDGSGNDHLFSELITDIESVIQPVSSSRSHPKVAENDDQQPCTSTSTMQAANGATSPKMMPGEPAEKKTNLFSKERKFQCNICNKRFPLHCNLSIHLRRVHDVLKPRSVGLFGCRYCGKLLSSMYELHQHKKQNHGITRKKAKKNTTTRVASNTSKIGRIAVKPKQPYKISSPPMDGRKHGISRLKAQKDGGVICKCGSQFQKLSYLKSHISYYRAKHLFKCPVCRYGFGAACLLKNHMLRSHNKTFDMRGCRRCGKCFKTHIELCLHMKITHKNYGKKVAAGLNPTNIPNLDQAIAAQKEKVEKIPVRPLSTKVADAKTVVRAPNAQKQLVTRKKHGVDMSKRNLGNFCICGVRCTLAHNLRAHIMYFTKERKFLCQLCNRRFLYLANLKAHMTTAHQVTDLVTVGSSGCAECGLVFSTYYELMQHRKFQHSHFNVQEVSTFSNNITSKIAITTPSSVASTLSSSSKQTTSIVSTPRGRQSGSKTYSPKRTSLYSQDEQQRQHGIDLLKLPTHHVCVCGREFENMTALKSHINLSNQKDDGTTPTSDFPSKKPASMPMMHKPVRFTNSSDLFFCYCGSQFGSNKVLQKHIQKTNLVVEPASMQQIAIKKIGIKKNASKSLTNSSSSSSTENHGHNTDMSKQHLGFFCTCGYEVVSNDNLASHIQYFKLGKNFQCDHCSKKWRGLKELKKHRKSAHKIFDVTGSVGCKSCGVIFPSKKAFSKHWTKTFTPEGKLANVFCPLKDLGQKNVNLSSTDSSSNLKESTISDLITKSSKNKQTRLSAALLAQTASSHADKQDWVTISPSISVRIGPSNGGTEILTHGNSSNPMEEETDSRSGQMRSQSKHPVHGVDTSRSAEGNFCYCGQQCSYKYTLNRHIKRFTTKGKFICRNCGENFTCASFLRKHMLRVHKIVQNVSVGCKECGELFPTNLELYNHFKVFHNLGSQVEPWEPKYTPPVPFMSSSQSQELSQEQAMELEVNAGAGADSNAKSSEVVEKENHQPILQDPLSENVADKHQCSCGKKFASGSSLRKHVSVKKTGKIFKCSWCPISFDTHSNLKKHVRMIHKVDYQKGKFACGVCAETFPSSEGVRSHRRSVHANNQAVRSDHQRQHEFEILDQFMTTAEVAMNVYET